MTEGKDYLGEKLQLVERAREDTYFRRLDQALIDEMRRKRAEAAQASEEPEWIDRPYGTILIPVDFSPDATEGLLHAGSLAKRYEASLIVLHVASREHHRHMLNQHLVRHGMAEPDSLSEHAVDAIPAETLEATSLDLREQSYTALQQFLPPHLAALSVELRVVIGHPVERIVETAVQEQVDLIVMGTHGRTGLRHAMIGGVAERVVRLAPCAVLTVKTAASHEAGWLERFYEDFLPPRPY